jgi:hypothetical protein
MHGLYLEHVTGQQTEDLRCYPLPPDFETIVRK